MPTSHPPGRPPAGEFLRGLAALLVAAGIVLGLPAFLWTTVGWPLPHSIPTAATLRNALFHGSISDQVILNGLALLTWVAWAQFLACLIAEVHAAFQGRLPHRVPLAAWGAQALAARLVAASLLLAPLTTLSRPTIAATPVVAKTTVTRVFDSNIPEPHGAPTAGTQEPTDGHMTKHVVQPRETLWDIAERHLGDGRLWPKIFDSNRDRPQPDGRRLSNPNRIHPGWTLVLPDNLQLGVNGSADHPAEPTPPPESPDPQPPAASSTSEPPPSTKSDHRAETPHGQHVRLPSGALVGITFATALSAALALAWLHRRRAYRPSPPRPGMRETDPLATPAVRRICHVVRQPDDEDANEPGTAAPIPITRARKPRTERPPTPSHLRTIALGTRDGAEIPLDLAAAGILGFAGAGAHAAVRALIASALATGHGDAAQILLVGDDLAAELLPDASPPQGLSVAANLDVALASLEVELVHRTRLLDRDEAPDIASFAEAHPAEPLPLLLLVSRTSPPALQQRLGTVAALGRRLGIGAVLLDPSPDGPTIEVAGDGHVDAIDPPTALPELAGAWLFTLPVDEVRQVLAVIATAHGATPTPTPPAGGEPADQPSAQVAEMVDRVEDGSDTPPVSVRLFGPTRIDALGAEVRSGLRTKARELLGFLLLHPAGVNVDQIVDALWPDVDPQRGVQRFRTTLGNLRSSLKLVSAQPDAAAVEWTGTHYRIQADLFDCDTWRFQAALDQAAHEIDPAAQVAALEQAVACHQGDLLEGSGAMWVEPAREDLRRRAIDALVHLSELHQQADNAEAAAHAIERAIALDPYAEDLYRRAMRLYAHLGRPDGVRRTLRHLENRLEELDVDLDEITSRLAEKLLAQASEDLPAGP
jgi:DNA-binding SARP family transcriptional activator